jgi:TRAP transporter TAXI family solute receptor
MQTDASRSKHFKQGGEMRKASTKDHIRFFAPAIVLTLFGFLVAYQFVTPAPPRHITINTGSVTGNYYKIGLQFKEILARDKVTLTVKETSGSLENLQAISSPEGGVDVIFMQGGVTSGRESENLVSLGSLYFEPLWVYHRAALTIRHLSDMRGLRISIGLPGSGTRALSLQLLSFNGVTEENSTIVQRSSSDAAAQLLTGEIDAAFFVVGYPSQAEQKLLYSENVKLMNFRRAEAYTRRLHFLSQVKLPEGAIDFENNVPDDDIILLAPTSQLVARADFHPALVDLLLQAAEEISASGGLFEKPDDFPAPHFLDFPLSEEAKRYYASGPPFLRRYLPFWLANFLNRMKILLLPLLALLFPLVKLLPPFYQWRVRSRIFRWYDLLMEIDYQMLHGDIYEKNDEFMSRLNWIEQEVSKISVPRGFSRELYDMRIHIEMLRGKLIAAGADSCHDQITEP